MAVKGIRTNQRLTLALRSWQFLNAGWLVIDIISLFKWSKHKWLFCRAGFFLANSELRLWLFKTFQIALIGWIKAGPPKKPLLFWSCKQATCDPICANTTAVHYDEVLVGIFSLFNSITVCVYVYRLPVIIFCYSFRLIKSEAKKALGVQCLTRPTDYVKIESEFFFNWKHSS